MSGVSGVSGSSASRRRSVAIWSLIIVTVLGIWTARVLIQSRAELREAEALLGSGDDEGALEHLGRAARLDAPGSPWSARARQRIEELATNAEAHGERGAALASWRELRSAILATRSLWPRHRELLARADGRIAALSAALESPSVDPGSDEAARASWHAARLAESDDEQPSPTWSLLALLGLALWITCALGFITRALDERLRLRTRSALGWSLGVALGFALFLLGLARA